MLADAQLTAFVATANPELARSFYEETLGLRLVADSPFALVFDSNGVELRIQKVQSVSPPSATALGWQDDLGIWTSPGGARVAWFKDPDGNMLSVTQS